MYKWYNNYCKTAGKLEKFIDSNALFVELHYAYIAVILRWIFEEFPDPSKLSLIRFFNFLQQTWKKMSW